jgi:hypothetical protein
MDHGRPDRAIHDDELEQIAGPVGPEHQIAGRIFAHLLDHDRVPQRLLDLIGIDAVAQRRAEDVHLGIVVRNLVAVSAAAGADTTGAGAACTGVRS